MPSMRPGTVFPVDGVTLMMIDRRAIIVALLFVNSCTTAEPEPPADASTGPVFSQTNVGEVGCPAAFVGEAKCWEIGFENRGTPGDGYCDLRQRGRSYVQVIKGAGEHVQFEAAPSGLLDDQITIAVWPGRRDRFFIPTWYCYPGPRF
jgi:hypothetical protein